MTYLDQAVADCHATIDTSGRRPRILYVAVNHSEYYDDPEERVRAEFWAELIYVYGYQPQRIGVEITVPDRTPRDAADLVVFRDDRRKRPYGVIECKPDGISDAEFKQAVEQAAGNGTADKFRAEYVGVVAGKTKQFLDFTGRYGVLEREKNIIANLPFAYGKPEEFRFRKGTAVDIAPVSRDELIRAIEKSHQTLWGGGKLSPPQAFGELCKLIFVKISDESGCKVGDPYQFQIKTNETSSRLAGRIRKLYDVQKKRQPEVFTDTIAISDEQVRSIVSHLQEINLNATDLDVKGLAFERFMDGFFKGDFGQFFTPRNVIELAVAMVKPKSTDSVLDPACGSGGFLLYAMHRIRGEATQYGEEDTPSWYRHWHDFAKDNLFGIEINEEICRVAKMNMILHDDGHSNVICDNALRPIGELTAAHQGFKPGTFDVVLTNPPFGAKVELAESRWLARYELGQTIPTKTGHRKPRKSQKTEIIFIERVWEFLVPGTGRAGIVLPDGVLYNATLYYVREFMRDRFEIQAIVSLPAVAFAHYGTTVKASIVILRRRGEGESVTDAPTFMAAPAAVGYDSTGRQIAANELPRVLANFEAFERDSRPFLPGA
jgi:type I restriction enzyme M protein